MELHVEAEFLSTSIMATLFSLNDCFCNQDLYIYILPYLADRLILQYLPAVNKHFYAQTYYYIWFHIIQCVELYSKEIDLFLGSDWSRGFTQNLDASFQVCLRMHPLTTFLGLVSHVIWMITSRPHGHRPCKHRPHHAINVCYLPAVLNILCTLIVLFIIYMFTHMSFFCFSLIKSY